jgi:hypothetical protein
MMLLSGRPGLCSAEEWRRLYEACEKLNPPDVTGIEIIYSGTPTMGTRAFESYVERYAAVPAW